MKTMAIRLDDELHAQLQVVAQLSGVSITEIIREAIEANLEARRSDPALADHADAVLADIDKDAKTRREAIASLFKSSGKSDSTKRGTNSK